MNIGRTKRSRLLALVMALAMCLSVLFVSVGAVSGSQVAADGTYTAEATVSPDSDKDFDAYPTKTTITVSGGEITAFSTAGYGSNYTAESKNAKKNNEAASSIESKVVGQEASVSTINSISKLDSVSGATCSAKGIKQSVLNALATAPVASTAKTEYTVTFNLAGKGSNFTQIVEEGSTPTVPSNPTASGYNFDGWYTTSSYTALYNFSNPITSNTTIYAKWSEENETPVVPDPTPSTGNTEVTITKESASASKNDLNITKTLAYDKASDSFTLTITAKATKAAETTTTYQVDDYDTEYYWDDLSTGNYYYLYYGDNWNRAGEYCQIHTMKYYSNDKGRNYYVAYFDYHGTRYYLDSDEPEAYSDSKLDDKHPETDDKSDHLYKVHEKKKVDEDLADHKYDKLPLYVKSSSSSNEIKSTAYLKDQINTTNFDISSANIISNASATLSNSGAISATGYAYSANYGGTPLTITITGLKAKTTGTNLTVTNGTSGIYASNTSTTPLVSAGSPTVTIKDASYTITYLNEDGSNYDTETVASGKIPNGPTNNPTKTDPTGQYVYEFAGWKNQATGEVGLVSATANTTYIATFRIASQGYHIIVEDYTNGGATTNVDANKYYKGAVTITVKSNIACALGLHEDGAQSTYMDQNGTYTRLKATANSDGSYSFTVNVTNKDVYLVLVVKGDSDLNGRTNLRDANNISKNYTKRMTLNNLQTFAADTDGNSRANLRDANNISKSYTKRLTISWDV